MFWLLLQLFLCSSTYAASEGEINVCTDTEWSESVPERQALDRARKAYINGCHDVALQLFQQMTDEAPTQPTEVFLKALTFLGEIQYKLGNREGSLLSFQRVLSLSPSYQISILDHDPEAVKLFELARVLQKQQLKADSVAVVPVPVTLPRLPASAYLPFGVPQFSQGRPVLGSAFALTQFVAAAVSVGTFVHISQRWSKPYQKSEARQANWIRFGAQWPATLLFWGAYAASYLDAKRHWRARRSPARRVKVDVGLGTEVVWIAARFHVL